MLRLSASICLLDDARQASRRMKAVFISHWAKISHFSDTTVMSRTSHTAQICYTYGSVSQADGEANLGAANLIELHVHICCVIPISRGRFSLPYFYSPIL
jgi:hypothetical protein